MRNKDLKKMLKNSIENVEIKDYTNEILNKVDHKVVAEEKPEPKRKRHLGLGLSLSGLGVALATVLILFFVLRPAGPTPGPGPLAKLEKKEMVLSKEVVALGNMIESLGSMEATTSLNSYKSTLLSDDDSDEDEDEDKPIDIAKLATIAKEMNNYLYAADSFINKDNIEVSVGNNDDKEYSFEFKMIIIMKDEGFSKEYKLYYNEMKKANEVELEGIILIDGEAHEVEGEREDDGDEVELELKVYTSKNSYIAISNETEINENEYEYTFYQDGAIIKGVSMEIVNDSNERKAEIEIIENNIQKSFEFTYFDDYIEAEYEDMDLSLEIIIKIEASHYLYLFEEYDYEIKLDK